MKSTNLMQVLLLLVCCQSAVAPSPGETYLTFQNKNFAFARYSCGKQDHRVTGSLRDFDWEPFCIQCASTEQHDRVNFHRDVVIWFKEQSCLKCGIEVLAEWVWEHNGTGLVEVEETLPGRHARATYAASGANLIPVGILMGGVQGLTTEMFKNEYGNRSFTVVGTGNEWIAVYDTYRVASSSLLSAVSVHIIFLASFRAYTYIWKEKEMNKIASLLVMFLEVIANVCRLTLYVDPLYTQGRYGYALGRFLITLSTVPAFLSIAFVALTLSEATSNLMQKSTTTDATTPKHWGKWRIMIAICLYLVVQDVFSSYVMAFTQYSSKILQYFTGSIILLQQVVVGVYFWIKCSKVIRLLRMSNIQPSSITSSSSKNGAKSIHSGTANTIHSGTDRGSKLNRWSRKKSNRLERMSRLVRLSAFFMFSTSTFTIMVSVRIATKQPVGHWFTWTMVYVSLTASSYLRVISFQLHSKHKTRLYMLLSCEWRKTMENR